MKMVCPKISLTLAATKRVITESRSWAPADFWREQMKIIMPVFGSKDAKEGAIAFAEKRPRTGGVPRNASRSSSLR